MAAMEDAVLLFINPTSLMSTIVILLIVYLFFHSFDSQKKEPPGPRPLPLLGNLLQLDPKFPHYTLYELSKKWGPIFTLHFGPKKAVVLAGYKMIKRALVKNDAFVSKKILPIFHDLKLTHGIIFSNGDVWREMRSFALANLKQFGMGKRLNEERVIEEIQYLIDVFKKKEGKAFDTTLPVSYAVSNIICSFVYGKRFDYDDQEFRSMVDQARKNTQLLGSSSVQLYNSFPWLFRWVGARKQLIKGAFANRKHVTEKVKHLEATLNPQMSRGFVDSFLVRKRELEASGKTNSHFHQGNLQMAVVNLLTAGTDSTLSTLTFGLLAMAKYPEIQEQVQMELSRVIGSRPAHVEDRKNLPYTDAVIHEIQRLSSVVPFSIRLATRDVTFQGYHIKKETPVIVLLSSALRDEDVWEKSYTFNPGHFLDKEGNFRTRDAFLPFSAGSRNCIGESMARIELFLFFTYLLQHFRFTPPPGVSEKELDLTPVTGFAMMPSQHKLCAISRY